MQLPQPVISPEKIHTQWYGMVTWDLSRLKSNLKKKLVFLIGGGGGGGWNKCAKYTDGGFLCNIHLHKYVETDKLSF